MNDYSFLDYSFTALPFENRFHRRLGNNQMQKNVSEKRVVPPLLNLSVFPQQKREKYSYKSNVNGTDIFANNMLFDYLISRNNPFNQFLGKFPDNKPNTEEQTVDVDRYISMSRRGINTNQEHESPQSLPMNGLFDKYVSPDNPCNQFPTSFQYKQPIYPPMNDEQSKVMADIDSNPKLVFTPAYTKWREYIMKNSPKYLERLCKRLSAAEKDYVYDNNFTAFTALSNETKGQYGESRVRRKSNEVAPRVIKPLVAAFAAPFALEGAMTGVPMVEQQIGKELGYVADKFAKTAFGQKVLPTLTKIAESKTGKFAGTAINTGLSAYGAGHLASEDGVRKSVGHVLDGDLGKATMSAAGDLLDLSLFGRFAPRATKGVANFRVKHMCEDFTDFNMMVRRINSPVEFDGGNPFTDGIMTGFRKWALDNGAAPSKILEVERRFSPNNWSALRKYTTTDLDFAGFSPGYDEISMYSNNQAFNQVFPHEVEHRLLYHLFGNSKNYVSANEVNAAFWKDGAIWGPRYKGYFIENDFEEILVRFTQIKNALGISSNRALTESELKFAYRKFKEGSLRLGNNNMSEFFDSIKDWKAAAKLSGKALSIAGAGSLLNQ